MSAQIYLKQDNKWKPFELGTAETKQILQEKNIVIQKNIQRSTVHTIINDRLDTKKKPFTLLCKSRLHK